MEPNEECIIHRASQSIKLEKIGNTTEEIKLDFENAYNAIYNDFVYTDELVTSCNEMELSIYIAVIAIIVIVLLIIVAVIAYFVFRSYRKKCYELLENETTLKTDE